MEIRNESVERLDRLLSSAVERALESNSGATIGVAVTGHVVGLGGLVRTEAERPSAVDTARGIAGVVTILDDIVVMNSIQPGVQRTRSR